MKKAISITTKLTLTDTLPLTCTRTGTCCHGKMVWLNPWELARLAAAKNMTPRTFADHYCEFGGIRLRFNGAPGWKGMKACSQYDPNLGCSVHTGRPLACRLYPLGRQRRSDELHYIYEGKEFPCIDGCPEVVELPHLTISDYIAGQDALSSEVAQDEYLELMQQLADGAFALLLETGLAASGDRQTLRLWRTIGKEIPDLVAKRLGSKWIDHLMLPDLSADLNDPTAFCKKHYNILQSEAQTSFGALGDTASLSKASGLMMALALHLGRSLGANPAELAEHWIKTAKQHGACE